MAKGLVHHTGEIASAAVAFIRALPPQVQRRRWIWGKDPRSGAKFTLFTGAGLGNEYLILAVHLPDKTVVYEFADVNDLVRARVHAILAEYRDTVHEEPYTTEGDYRAAHRL